MTAQYDFNSPDAVVQLGVGKNMVAAIRYWTKCFGLTKDNALTDIAHYIFDNENGNQTTAIYRRTELVRGFGQILCKDLIIKTR